MKVLNEILNVSLIASYIDFQTLKSSCYETRN
jgi:hypothetical protein